MKAEYIDHMGTDLTVVNAARVSFGKESDLVEVSCLEYPNCENPFCDGTKLDLSERDIKLINYLARYNHFTPFTHCSITMRERVPIFLARQRFKHQVGFTYNEVSRRYVDSEPEFYIPKEWRERAENKKQGSSEPFDEDLQYHILNEYKSLSNLILASYDYLLREGVCPEQARMVLPQSMYTEYYVTGSLAAWARAYKLRTQGEYQKEWDEITPQWNQIISELFPVSWRALNEHNS